MVVRDQTIVAMKKEEVMAHKRSPCWLIVQPKLLIYFSKTRNCGLIDLNQDCNTTKAKFETPFSLHLCHYVTLCARVGNCIFWASRVIIRFDRAYSLCALLDEDVFSRLTAIREISNSPRQWSIICSRSIENDRSSHVQQPGRQRSSLGQCSNHLQDTDLP
jgi:hypothetical protein